MFVRTIAITTLSAALLFGFQTVGWTANEIKIGGMAPITGNVATFGVDQKNAY
jgi:hypothetical protein